MVRTFKDKTAALNHAQQLVNRFENIPAEPEPKEKLKFSPEPPATKPLTTRTLNKNLKPVDAELVQTRSPS